MELPKYNNNLEKKKQVKYCQYMECGKEFIGTPVRKYCDFHVDPRQRKRIRFLAESPDIKNQIFRHFFTDSTLIEFSCVAEGCTNKFFVEVIPKQYVYPKYCEKHRNEFRRINFERLQKKETVLHKQIIRFG